MDKCAMGHSMAGDVFKEQRGPTRLQQSQPKRSGIITDLKEGQCDTSK